MTTYKPGESPLLFTLPASGLSATVYASGVDTKFTVRDFNRDEWLNSRLQGAQTLLNNARPIILTNATNSQVQVAIGDGDCSFPYAVPLGPEDNNIPYILQRQNITEYSISGANSSPSAVASLQPIATAHKKLLDKFDAYLAELGQNISYERLIALRSETFSYLTTTGMSISGLDINVSNVALISDFNMGTVHYNVATNTAITKGWSATIQIITFQSRTS